MRDRRTALLLVALVVFGLALGVVSLGFYTGILIPHSEENGILVVKALMVTSSLGVPIVGATVLVDAGAVGKTTEVLFTNSSGEALLQLPVGAHSLVVYNEQFSIPDSFSILNNRTTTADVYVSHYLVTPVFSDLKDPDYTGNVSSWQPITTAVNSSSAQLLLSSTAVFFNAAYAPTGGGSLLPEEVHAILYSQPVSGGTDGLWWISWQPTTALKVTDLSSLTLSTYSATIQVRTSGA